MSRPAPTIHLFGRRIGLPRSRASRVTVGVLLIFGGTLGFLPVLGFWMIPLGLLMLSHDFAFARRWRRRFVVWRERRRAKAASRQDGTRGR